MVKQKHNAGFSLVEVLVAITVLAILFVPTCTSLLMSMNLNAGTDVMMRAEFAVSSTVEKLMAEGIVKPEVPSDTFYDDNKDGTDRFPDVTVTVSKDEGVHYYNVTVTSTELDSVSVTTRIRSVEAVKEEVGTE
ncbi:MAG: prepilin-type N-terminal cleavage/methylation domain-containing protein [Oscillospiraceae bacterium]|nr:prepilin-type N-terminal cleavage/methylation domain-containing protein [Oscillospiraceae bacterium]